MAGAPDFLSDQFLNNSRPTNRLARYKDAHEKTFRFGTERAPVSLGIPGNKRKYHYTVFPMNYRIEHRRPRTTTWLGTFMRIARAKNSILWDSGIPSTPRREPPGLRSEEGVSGAPTSARETWYTVASKQGRGEGGGASRPDVCSIGSLFAP